MPALLVVLLLLLIPAAAGAAPACPVGEVTGSVARVVDGDTLQLANGLRVRLQGVAAPERHQPGGKLAAGMLVALVGGAPALTCAFTGVASYDRCEAVCRDTETGDDLAEALVWAGFALDCPRFSGGRYADEESEAAEAGATIRETYPLPRYCVPRRARPTP